MLVTSLRSLELAQDTVPDALEYRVQELEGEDASMALFRAACASPLADEHTPAARELVQLLYGHPSSIVLLAGQVRDGGAKLNALRQQLVATEPADLELLVGDAELLGRDRKRARSLVASLNLAYQPLAQASPQAAELLAWLGTLPAGLSVAMLSAIFGPDTPQHLADLSLHGLLELQQDSLVLAPPVRWYAEHKLETAVPRERQLELLERTLGALEAFMAACYKQLGKPGAGAVIAASLREEANLAALVRRFERLGAAAPERSSLLARTAMRWSQVRLHGGTLTEATALAARALDLTDGADRADQAALQGELGDLFLRTDRLPEAEAAYQAALDAFTAIDARLGAANTQRARGDLFLRTARLLEAEAAYQAALDAFTAIDARLGAANTHLARGDLFLRTNRLPEAEAAYQAALDAFTAIDARLGAANTQRARGDLFLRTDRLPEAEAAYQAALDAFTAIDARLGAANTHKARGDLFLRTDRLPEAEAAYQAALDAFTAIDERLGAANTHKARGDLFLRTARPPEAEAAFQAALDAFTAIDERLGAANTHKARGDLFLRTDRLPEAEAAYQAALDAFTAIDERLGAASTRSSLGQLALAHGDVTGAFHRLRQVRAEMLQLDERLGAAGQLGYLAQAALSGGQHDRAMLLAGRAWQELAALDDGWGQMLAASTVLEAARHASDEAGVPAAIFAWQVARTLRPVWANKLAPLMEQVLPAEVLASGLPPEALAQVEQRLHQLFEARWQAAMAAGDDPLGPLTPTSQNPPTSGESSSP
ncbi:MAG: tetratricopeptide repeat protein [Myxococcales bacterium]|nr:tetratricopeptide repeat protein [Myxococcales bacterium]